VKVSLSTWNLNATHDLAILGSYQSTPHAINIPWKQLAGGINSQQYKNFVGGAVVNYGKSAETGIVVKDTVKWTPAGGSSTTIHTSSYNVGNIANADDPIQSLRDSVQFGFGASSTAYSLTAPSGPGVYSYKYNLTYNNTDEVPQDNTYSFNQYATDSIFCKGFFDYDRGQPYISQGIRPGSIATSWSWGPMYYVTKGKYAARKIQYYVSTDQPSLDGMEAYGLLFKWTDGSNSQPNNTYAEGDELKLVGLSRNLFSALDSQGKVVLANLSNPTNATKPVILDSNSWYWTAAQGTNNMFIGTDETMTFFTRSYIQKTQSQYNDMPELLWTDDYSGLAGSSTSLPPFPFSVVTGSSNVYDADSIAFDKFYYIPNIALHLSKNEVTVGVNEVAAGEIGTLNVFPIPANNQLNVQLKLAAATAKAEYRLLDLTGKVAYKVDRLNVQNDSFSISTECLASGVYYLAVFTENGHTTEKVVIRH
jgi:hypothetical protein